MRALTIGLSLILFVATSLLSGCGYYYKVHQQTPHEIGPIQSAQKFYVRPPAFGKISRPEDYESDGQWATDLADIQKEYGEQVVSSAADYGLQGRVVPVNTSQAVTDGILVESDVVQFRPEWSVMGGGFDYLILELKFTDVASNKVLYEGKLEVSSKVFGPVGWRANSVNGRIAIATWNIAPPIMSIVKTGKITPLED